MASSVTCVILAFTLYSAIVNNVEFSVLYVSHSFYYSLYYYNYYY